MLKHTVSLSLALVAALLVGCSGKDEPKTSKNPAPAPAAAPAPAGGMSGMAHAGGTAALPAGANKTCPVTGEDVDATVFVEYQGKKVYFCCGDCIATFKSDPAAYFAKAYPAMPAAPAVPATPAVPAMPAMPPPVAAALNGNATCPVTGNPVNPEVYVEFGGKKVYFCCKNCIDTFNADPATWFAKAYPGVKIPEMPKVPETPAVPGGIR